VDDLTNGAPTIPSQRPQSDQVGSAVPTLRGPVAQ
jgi:hypothetical protein